MPVLPRYFLNSLWLLVGVSVMATGALLATVDPVQAQNSQRCFALEQQLARASGGQQNRRSKLPRLKSSLRKANLAYRRAQARADRLNCYSTFFFTKTLKGTARCRNADRQIRRANQKRQSLQRQINSAGRPTNNRAQRDRIIRALARNRCGAQYQRAARRTAKRGWNPFGSVFGDGFETFFDNAPRDLPPDDGIRVGSTYRTMCVRTCDGYYFPVSFSTLPSRFQKDASRCASSCAAPSELFVYRNPGAEVEQMVSLDGRAYSKIKNAFRYRKEYIKGCSCRQADYDPLAGTAQAASADGTGGDGADQSDGTRPMPPRVEKKTDGDGEADTGGEDALPKPSPKVQTRASEPQRSSNAMPSILPLGLRVAGARPERSQSLISRVH